MDVNMLKEPDVIKAVCKKLRSAGYKIGQELGPKEHGVDIIAERAGEKKSLIKIEAKGATSSNE
jgi:hypothetical protein